MKKKQKQKKISKKSKKVKSKPKKKLSKKVEEQNRKATKLTERGKERGFVTYDEILKEFPTVEDDVMFLDRLYEKLQAAGVDILDSGGCLRLPMKRQKNTNFTNTSPHMIRYKCISKKSVSIP